MGDYKKAQKYYEKSIGNMEKNLNINDLDATEDKDIEGSNY